MSSQQIHAIVRGRVQGVGFRATVEHHANKLRLKGFVKNLEDGSVEILAVGKKEDLELLIDRLKADAGLSKIDQVIVDFSEPKKSYEEFNIVF